MLQLRWVFKNLKGSGARYVFAHILNLVLSCFILVWPIMTRKIVSEVLVGVADPLTGQVFQNTALLWPLLALWMALVILRDGINVLFVYCKESASQNLGHNVRLVLFRNVMAQEGFFFTKTKAGDLLTRFTSDLDIVTYNTRHILFQLVSTIVMFLVAVTYFFTINWLLTLCLLAVMPLLYITSRRFSKEMRPLYIQNRDRLTELNDMTQENIDANKTVRAFAREDYEIDRFGKANRSYLDAVLNTNKTWLSIWPLPEFLSQFLTVIVLVVGGILTVKGKMTVADMTAFTALIWALANSIRNFGNLLNDFQRFFPSADKIIEVYYAQPHIVSPSNAVAPTERLRGDIRFDHVSLKLRNAEIVDDIDFSVKAGQTLAIVGETGSGKTTLINLLARFFDVSSGCIYIDGVDVRRYDLQALRRSIGMATQDVFLFSDTIDGNVSFGVPDLPEDDVKDAAVRAAADEFVREMPEDYETIIGERGMGLSGGQRQRIALARALAVRPSILILDDTTSAVDTKTERYIWQQLQSLPFPCTKIIIAQRISTVSGADQILVMQDGRITECGTHRELIAREGFYREIYEIQSQQTE